jgi:hypothetical protein
MSERIDPADMPAHGVEWEKLSSTQNMEVLVQIRAQIASGTSKREACRDTALDHSTTFGTVYSAYNRFKDSGWRLHGNNSFSVDEELALVGVLEGFSLKHRPLTRSMFLDQVRKMPGMGPRKDLDSWYSGFRQRHKKRLSQRAIKGLEDARTADETLDLVQNFCDAVGKSGWHDKLPANVFLNADETRIKIDGEQNSSPAIESTANSKHAGDQAPMGKAASYTPFVNAHGEVIMELFTVPTDSEGNAEFDLSKQLRGRDDTYWSFSETGYVDSEIFFNALKTLKKVLDRIYPGLEAVLFLDRLSCHVQPETMKWCEENGIHPIFFPAHCTHFLQPCDDLIFATFKKRIYELLQRYLVAGRRGRSLGQLLVKAAQEARSSISKRQIVAAFRNTGVHPWKPELIMQRARKNIAMVEESTATPIDPAELARRISMDIIRENAPDKNSRKVKVHRKDKGLFMGWEIAKQADDHEQELREKEAAKEAQRQQKLEERETKQQQKEERLKNCLCRGTKHTDNKRPVWRSGTTWASCQHCEAYFLCPSCKARDRHLLDDHVEACDQKK